MGLRLCASWPSRRCIRHVSLSGAGSSSGMVCSTRGCFRRKAGCSAAEYGGMKSDRCCRMSVVSFLLACLALGFITYLVGCLRFSCQACDTLSLCLASGPRTVLWNAVMGRVSDAFLGFGFCALVGCGVGLLIGLSPTGDSLYRARLDYLRPFPSSAVFRSPFCCLA